MTYIHHVCDPSNERELLSTTPKLGMNSTHGMQKGEKSLLMGRMSYNFKSKNTNYPFAWMLVVEIADGLYCDVSFMCHYNTQINVIPYNYTKVTTTVDIV